MAIHNYLKKFGGLPIRLWGADAVWSGFEEEDVEPVEVPLRAPDKSGFRIGVTYEQADEGVTWFQKFERFLAQKHVERVAGLVVGNWSPDDSGVSSKEVIKTIVKAARKLPNLRALFIGDITMEECEISWIVQSEVGKLLNAFPNLEHFGVRGGSSLRFEPPTHDRLKSLTVQAGGLSRKVVHEILLADLPALEHLELWLGTPNYGGDATPEDFAALLSGTRFPKLRYLGLRNSEVTDDLAAVMANAPILKKLKTLDLSLGTLSDAGAASLLQSKLLKRLEKLNIHHHFCSRALVKQLKAIGPKVDASDAKEAEDWGGGEMHRFVSVSE